MDNYYWPTSFGRVPAPAKQAAFTDERRFLQLVLKAIFNERKAQLFYRILSDRSTTAFQKEQVNHALDDEIKHERMLIQLYTTLTGQAPQVPHPGPQELADYQEGLKEAFRDELEAAEAYRMMMLMTHLQWVRDQLFELMTDEMEHAQRFTFLRAEQ
jgi:rubrerythrin